MYKFVLASQSPRRKELLENLGIEFTCHTSGVEEVSIETKPEEIVKDLAQMKAEDIAGFYGDDTVIIGADTIVVSGVRIMGKPHDRDEAYRMLDQLQGKQHSVYTGVCIIIKDKSGDKTQTFYEKTDVYMYPMTSDEINIYIDTDEPYDKAGGYAIQGEAVRFIQRIDGEYGNVVGLPIARLYQVLKSNKIL